MQGDEGAPEAWLELTPQAAPGLSGIKPGDELIVLTWLHLAQRWRRLMEHLLWILNQCLRGLIHQIDNFPG